MDELGDYDETEEAEEYEEIEDEEGEDEEKQQQNRKRRVVLCQPQEKKPRTFLNSGSILFSLKQFFISYFFTYNTALL